MNSSHDDAARLCGGSVQQSHHTTVQQDSGSSTIGEPVRCDTADDFPPAEDHIERLWTPQRMAYVLSEKHQDDSNASQTCPFCEAPGKSDEDGLIVWRGQHVFVIMNLYPYNVGHVMVCPYRHISMLTDLHDDELFEFEKTSTQAMRVMDEVSHPDGWNLGINQGAVAGAGVASHLHQHIVPRWSGDSNFMPIVAQTRTMPILLSDQREAYAQAFMSLFGGQANTQPKEKEN
ncbi:HIT family protein [Bifidobacterium sp.]|uniref:HIT family protein n=1 Tax=Bifidobacterium sp. TaxID=41200 RepID=UPI0025BBFA79|nr:HIT domain-containing protein [Bifidobacterium sp.]MCI1635747.1 HIT domain-containing protein [Bifidobacterium sp.]